MKLYSSDASPYSRKVKVVAAELGLTDLIEEVLTDPFTPSAELLAANPVSKIPTLVTERGEALPGSALIIEYLQTRGRGLAALPRGTKRWACLRRAAVAEGMLDAAVATVFEMRRPEGIRYMQFLDRQADMIRRAVAVLNLEAAELSLDAPGLVEVTTGVALAYLDFRLPYLEWHRGHEPLQKWLEVFAQRPSMISTAPTSA